MGKVGWSWRQTAPPHAPTGNFRHVSWGCPARQDKARRKQLFTLQVGDLHLVRKTRSPVGMNSFAIAPTHFTGRVCDSEAPPTVYGALLFWGHRLLCNSHPHTVLGKWPHFMSVAPEFQLVHGMRLPQWQLTLERPSLTEGRTVFSLWVPQRGQGPGKAAFRFLPVYSVLPGGAPARAAAGGSGAWDQGCQGGPYVLSPGRGGLRQLGPFLSLGDAHKKGRCCWSGAPGGLVCAALIPQRL